MVTMGDRDYFKKVTVTSSSFGSADARFAFNSTGIMLLNEGTGVIEFSFNGTDVHGELDSAGATKGLTFDNRTANKVWLRIKSGTSIVVAVSAWG